MKASPQSSSRQEAQQIRGKGEGGVNAFQPWHGLGIKQSPGYNGTFYEPLEVLKLDLTQRILFPSLRSKAIGVALKG